MGVLGDVMIEGDLRLISGDLHLGPNMKRWIARSGTQNNPCFLNTMS